MAHTLLRLAHASLQFSDTPAQQSADHAVIFDRGYQIITGTEAGQPDDRGRLVAAARDSGYHIYVSHDCWVAVDRAEAVAGSWSGGWVPVIDNDEVDYRTFSKGIAWLSFQPRRRRLGPRLTIGATHYLIHGGTPGEPYYALNARFGPALGKWAREKARGQALVFHGGDSNMNDARTDTFFGAPLTSVWDELKRWPNTGHGPIDVISSYDRDRRVAAADARALNDKALPLHGDHFLVEAEFRVRLLDG